MVVVKGKNMDEEGLKLKIFFLYFLFCLLFLLVLLVRLNLCVERFRVLRMNFMELKKNEVNFFIIYIF